MLQILRREIKRCLELRQYYWPQSIVYHTVLWTLWDRSYKNYVNNLIWEVAMNWSLLFALFLNAVAWMQVKKVAFVTHSVIQCISFFNSNICQKYFNIREYERIFYRNCHFTNNECPRGEPNQFGIFVFRNLSRRAFVRWQNVGCLWICMHMKMFRTLIENSPSFCVLPSISV